MSPTFKIKSRHLLSLYIKKLHEYTYFIKINHNKNLNSVVLRKLKYNGKQNTIKTPDRIIEITVIKTQEMV